MVSLRLQFFTFLNMIVVGMIIGIGFDLYRVVKSKFNLQRLVVDFCDILFSVLVTIVIFMGLVYSNGGSVRIYAFLGVSFGLIIYYLLVSDLVVSIFNRIVDSIFWVCSQLKRLIIFIYSKTKAIILKIKQLLRKNGD
ncbi:hypothetical protein JCM16358_16660 [Halanaerocella petrolearia]